MDRSNKFLSGIESYRQMSPEDKKRYRREKLVDNSLYIFLVGAIIIIQIQRIAIRLLTHNHALRFVCVFSLCQIIPRGCGVFNVQR